jgi:hypothetical protein
MLVALDATSNKGTVLVAGGLEMPAVTEQARHILEGGDEAFRARQLRYPSSKRTWVPAARSIYDRYVAHGAPPTLLTLAPGHPRDDQEKGLTVRMRVDL